MILLIDNYDSFVHNLARYVQRLGQQTTVIRNDQIATRDLTTQQYDAIIMSPGPCTPQEAGHSLQIVRNLRVDLPLLGICLGHQTIAAAFGGRVIRAGQPRHGQASDVTHDERGEFAGLSNPFAAGRYHSLVVDQQQLPSGLEVSAWTADGTIMAIRHRQRPIVGWQFHPESILTDCGFQLLANWLNLVGCRVEQTVPTLESERQLPRKEDAPWPTRPITF
ncbi:MAG: aminodeoxychorismate/anthranilate synthase component II [Planctomycetales bacterium]|nr:aminodeoxychorismate/anthranilate synthase component II [Planctomycetales bacterium]